MSMDLNDILLQENSGQTNENIFDESNATLADNILGAEEECIECAKDPILTSSLLGTTIVDKTYFECTLNCVENSSPICSCDSGYGTDTTTTYYTYFLFTIITTKGYIISAPNSYDIVGDSLLQPEIVTSPFFSYDTQTYYSAPVLCLYTEIMSGTTAPVAGVVNNADNRIYTHSPGRSITLKILGHQTTQATICTYVKVSSSTASTPTVDAFTGVPDSSIISQYNNNVYFKTNRIRIQPRSADYNALGGAKVYLGTWGGVVSGITGSEGYVIFSNSGLTESIFMNPYKKQITQGVIISVERDGFNALPNTFYEYSYSANTGSTINTVCPLLKSNNELATLNKVENTFLGFNVDFSANTNQVMTGNYADGMFYDDYEARVVFLCDRLDFSFWDDYRDECLPLSNFYTCYNDFPSYKDDVYGIGRAFTYDDEFDIPSISLSVTITSVPTGDALNSKDVYKHSKVTIDITDVKDFIKSHPIATALLDLPPFNITHYFSIDSDYHSTIAHLYCYITQDDYCYDDYNLLDENDVNAAHTVDITDFLKTTDSDILTLDYLIELWIECYEGYEPHEAIIEGTLYDSPRIRVTFE